MKRWLCVGAALVVYAIACSEEPEKRRFDDDASGNNKGNGAPAAQVGSGGGVMAQGVGGNASMASGMMQSGSTGGAPVTTTTAAGANCPNDQYEGNNSEQNAAFIGSIDDCDVSGLTFSGVLSGNDVDWFYYDGADVFGCSVNPSRSLMASGQARICKFLDCAGAVVGCEGNTEATSPGGLQGCCGVNGVNATIDCNGLSDDATVYLRIDKPAAIPCVSYSVDFHY